MTEFAQDNKISWEAITPELTSANHRLCWPQLESNIDSRATDLSEVGSYDLRDCLIPQAEWDAMHPPAADGTKVPRLPQPPAPIGDDALSKERALFNERKRIAAKAQNGERILRNQMARAFADIGSRISIPGTGLKTITTADQMSKMKAMCIPTLEDIRVLQAAIITWDASQDFESNVIARSRNIYLLNQANLCTQDYEKNRKLHRGYKGQRPDHRGPQRLSRRPRNDGHAGLRRDDSILPRAAPTCASRRRSQRISHERIRRRIGTCSLQT
jgi:hypothetical protein